MGPALVCGINKRPSLKCSYHAFKSSPRRIAGIKKDQIVQNGCRTQQATKPQPLSDAMIDSPVGVAAWILEKMHGWCDLTRGNEELLAWPPRSYVDRIYNVTQWTEMPRGGHFAAMEELELLIKDI